MIKKIIAEQNDPSDEMLIIHEIFVVKGQKVTEGDLLCLIEGSKALFDLLSQFNCEIEAIHVIPGQKVHIGETLITVKIL